MKITICSSISHKKEVLQAENHLINLGHQIKTPNFEEVKAEKSKASYMTDHFKKIQWSDAVLIINADKRGIKHYIGGNTLMEIGLAFYLQKPIFLLNPIPELPYTDEILATNPIVLGNNLDNIEI